MMLTLKELREIIKEELDLLREAEETKKPPTIGPQYPGKFVGQTVEFNGPIDMVQRFVPTRDKETGEETTIRIWQAVQGKARYVWDGKKWIKGTRPPRSAYGLPPKTFEEPMVKQEPVHAPAPREPRSRPMPNKPEHVPTVVRRRKET